MKEDQSSGRNSDHDLLERVQQLEIQLAFQQRVTDQLNEVLIDQAERLTGQQRQIAKLEQRLLRLQHDDGETRDPMDEKPPHY